MENSFKQDIRTRFIFIYIATVCIIVIIASLQYIFVVESEMNFNKEKILEKKFGASEENYQIKDNTKFVTKRDILSASLLSKEIPMRIVVKNKVHILFYTPRDGYYRFLVNPIIAITFIILFVYFVLNRVVKRWLLRLGEFQRFLYTYLEDSTVDEKLFLNIEKYDDEIYKLSVDTKKVMNNSLKISKKQKNFIRILEELNEVVLVISEEFDLVDYNKSWLKFEQQSNNFLDYLNETNVEKLLKQLDALKSGAEKKIIIVDNLKVEDSYFEIKIIHTNHAFGVIIRDISAIYKKHQETKHMALHDNLTNLPNRMLFLDRLSSEIKKAKREDKIFAVLFFDLNGFKSINDKYGHEAGDIVLKEFSERVSSLLRASDTLARLGGDEFVGIISDITNIGEIDFVIDKIHDTLDEPVIYNDKEITISTSIGVSIFPDDGDLVDILMLKADNAMYKSKKSGQKYCKYIQDT